MTTLDILLAARALISEPERWTKGAPARDASGVRVATISAMAYSFCAIGAPIRICREPSRSRLYEALGALADARGDPNWSGIGIWQDRPETTHADVLALFDRAIAAEQGKAVKP